MTEKTITRLRWASSILTGLAGLAAILVAADVGPAVHRWAALAVAVLGYGATWCAQRIPPPEKAPRGPRVPPAAVLAVLLLAAPGCTGAGWRAVALVQSAGKVADVQFASAGARQMATCIGQHGKGNPAYTACVEDSKAWKALTAWRRYGVPAVNSGTLATVAALQAGKDWKKALRVAGCALARIAKQWGPELGPAKATVLLAASAAEVMACD